MKSILSISVIVAILFFLLSPGVILTIPPTTTCPLFNVPFVGTNTCNVNYAAVAVHSFVFGLVIYLLLSNMLSNVLDNVIVY